MLSIAQQMLQDSRTKVELLRMQIIKVSQARNGGSGGAGGTFLCRKAPLNAVLPPGANVAPSARSDREADGSSGAAGDRTKAPHEDRVCCG